MSQIHLHHGDDLGAALPRLEAYLLRDACTPLSRHPGWLNVLRQGLGHTPYCLEAVQGEATRGVLPLAYVGSFLFGRFLVSLPYLNYGGVAADDEGTRNLLIERAVKLADELGVRYLELRQGQAVAHPALAELMSAKVQMRLALPGSSAELWKSLNGKVRNQVRKGQKSELTVAWGGEELLPEFHAVFTHNMRDLGTPAYGKKFFRAILSQFPGQAELCVVRAAREPVAGALLLHGQGITEVPSAGCLRKANASCANMLMYWQLLERAIQRQQSIFDFGRSSKDGGTFRFKEQWGAQPTVSDWQYHVRVGQINAMRPDNPRYQRLIRWWQRLPVALTRLIGPHIVRGIP